MLHEHGKIISGLRLHRPTFHAEIVTASICMMLVFKMFEY